MSFLDQATQTDEFQSNMRALESQQGSTEWLRWRGKGIGSSDASTLLGINPWKSLQELFDDKLGRGKPFEGNSRTRRGQDLEPIARRLYEEQVGAEFKDAIEVHPVHTFMRASYDGINRELKKVLEIKSPGKKAHAEALAGRVPDYYVPQCQWLLLVSGYSDLDYVSFDGDNIVIIPVKPDPDMQKKLTEQAIWFWDCVTNDKPPHDFTVGQDLEAKLAPLIEKYRTHLELAAMTEELLAATKAEIKELTDGLPDITIGGFKIARSTRKGSIDYSKIPELANVDVEAYRKPEVEIFALRALKEESISSEKEQT